MPKPMFCPHEGCVHHRKATGAWLSKYGFYQTAAHGRVRRYQCRSCGTTMSDQTESVHYFAKRHLPLRAIAASLLGGASQREVARRYGVSPMAIHHAVLRLGRQAMAAQIVMLSWLPECRRVVFDGLRSCVTSQDYPCDITTVVEPQGEMILSMTHAITRRGGRMTAAQQRRSRRKYRVWSPADGSMRDSISLITNEIADYLRPPVAGCARIDTDENPLYRAVIAKAPVSRHLIQAGQLQHLRTPSTAPRTPANRLFAVNYVDRLLRHRMKEHTRETIAIGRNAVMQMHRAWLFAWDHNVRREHRVNVPQSGVHARVAGLDPGVVERVRRRFFTRRLRSSGAVVPQSVRAVWLGAIQTPPVRWRVAQVGTSVRIPHYAIRDLNRFYQHAC